MAALRPLLPFALCFSLPLWAQVPDGTVGSTGTIQHGETTLTVVRAADGHVWLQQNLGADHVATSLTDAAAYGDLYQWGRWEDGHQLRTSSTGYATLLSPDNPVGLGAGDPLFRTGGYPNDWWLNGTSADRWSGTTASATNGIDPCALLGEGWSLPTQADWVAVLNAEGITNLATGFASYLKLPASGSRDSGNGTLINAGLHGNYWCSTPNGSYAKDLTVSPAALNTDDDAYRGYGMCIRCLNKHLHVGIDEQQGQGALQLFPNPSTGLVLLDQGALPMTSVRVFAMDGRLVHEERVQAARTLLSLEDVPSGVYWLRVEGAAGSVCRKLVIER